MSAAVTAFSETVLEQFQDVPFIASRPPLTRCRCVLDGWDVPSLRPKGRARARRDHPSLNLMRLSNYLATFPNPLSEDGLLPTQLQRSSRSDNRERHVAATACQAEPSNV